MSKPSQCILSTVPILAQKVETGIRVNFSITMPSQLFGSFGRILERAYTLTITRCETSDTEMKVLEDGRQSSKITILRNSPHCVVLQHRNNFICIIRKKIYIKICDNLSALLKKLKPR
jgi:hypothetical protein